MTITQNTSKGESFMSTFEYDGEYCCSFRQFVVTHCAQIVEDAPVDELDRMHAKFRFDLLAILRAGLDCWEKWEPRTEFDVLGYIWTYADRPRDEDLMFAAELLWLQYETFARRFPPDPYSASAADGCVKRSSKGAMTQL